MKFWFVTLMVIFPFLAFSQKREENHDQQIYKRAREVVDSFIHSRLGIEKGTVNLSVYNQFKNWFDLNATVEDDYNAVYNFDTKTGLGKYIIKGDAKPFDRYAHDIALQVKRIVIDSAGKIEAVDTLGVKRMVYSVYRKVSVWKDRKYVLPVSMEDSILKNRRDIDFVDNRDFAIKALHDKIIDTATYLFTTSATLTIALASNDAGIVRITSIQSKYNKDSVKCINDLDSDAILGMNDSLPDVPGDFTSDGRPDYDLDGMPDKTETNPPTGIVIDECKKIFGVEKNKGCPQDYFITKYSIDAFVGIQMNFAAINLPELNQLGYVDGSGNNATDILQSKKGSVQNPGLRAGIYTGGNFTFYLGDKKKKNGISLGITYTKFFADYQLTEPVIYTFKSNDNNNDYRRRVTIDSLSESIRYNVFNFPVMFSHRFKYNLGKLGLVNSEMGNVEFNFQFGPSLMVLNAESEYDASISFEGLYQTDENGIIYKDPFDDGDTYNVYFTAEELQARNPNRTAEDIFRELRNNNVNYDFADSKNFRGKQKNDSRITFGLNLVFNGQYHISDNWSFKAGLQAVYAPLPERNEKYIPIDKTTDPYNSIYNSSAKSSYSAFGLNAGLVYNF